MPRKTKTVNYTVPCALCGDEVDERLSYRELLGWASPLHANSATVVSRKYTGRSACYSCVSKLKQGVQPGQGTLL